MIQFFSTAVVLAMAPLLAWSQSSDAFFESRHTHPAALTPDGTRLLVLNSPDARLSVFDVSSPALAAPVLIAEIPAGLEPVSVRARTDDEVWVVSELSDAVFIISLSRHAIVATLSTPDEPADVVFANGRAFISCARSNCIRVFDAVSRAPLGVLPLQGLYPRALAANEEGTRVYAAFQLSGNGTTILPHTVAPPQPAPVNTALPAPPRTALIVPASDSRITYAVVDHDVVEIDAASLAVLRYLPSAGTNLFDLAVEGDRLWVANTESRNLTRFEPALRGHFIDNRLSLLPLGSGTAVHHDLNAGLNYATLPNPAAQAAALAQPAALALAGDSAWVAAFGSDRIARVNAAGEISARIDLRPAGVSSRGMRGPRGLVLQQSTGRLYVLNKLSNSVSVIDTSSAALLTEVPAGSHDPTPAAVKAGRGFLFDARLSGNGTMSCASCHLDADRDGLAWDLGDPGGAMMTVFGSNHSAGDATLRARALHPMKGPMVTQSLRGLDGSAPFHWRGDRATLQSFNATFDALMGGSELAPADIEALAAYLLTLRHHPNPNRSPDRTLPASFNGANPVRGRSLFLNHTLSHCSFCHVLPDGSDNNIDLPAEVGSTQPVKNTPLALVYQNTHFDSRPGRTSLSGFGMLHDGTGFALPTVHPYPLSQIEASADFADLSAFLLCFDSGTAPAVGMARTLDAANASAHGADLTLLEIQAGSAQVSCDTVATGLLGGKARAFLFVPATQTYRSDLASEAPRSRGQLISMLGSGDTLTFMGVPPGAGARHSIDRDGDGLLNGDEAVPALQITADPALRLTWPAGSGWYPQTAGGSAQWVPLLLPRSESEGFFQTQLSPAGHGFFRLRRTW
jgi:YVTN family beta-propeller protein